MPKPIIAVTMGDPAGVGPEVCLRALNDAGVRDHCVPVVFGDSAVLKRCGDQLGLKAEFPIIDNSDLAATGSATAPWIVHVPAVSHAALEPGKVTADTGAASFAYINRAIDAALAGHVAAVTTAPINKEALAKAGIKFPGHTEIFADRAGSDRWCMMQHSEEITCTFVTVHVGYADVPETAHTANACSK